MELIIFVGNIGVGKSLMASKLAKKGYVVVNNDAITTMIHGGEYGMYDVEKKEIYRQAELSTIEAALKRGFSVVVDRTNMKKSDRARYIEVGKKYSAEIICWTWNLSAVGSLERRLKNPRGIPAKQWGDVNLNMFNVFEKPTIDEGFDEIRTIPDRFIFHAFDFDGTIVENSFPEIGEIKGNTIAIMNNVWADISNIIIIWTCRSGDKLNEMRAFLIKEKIPFDFINENPLINYGSPKIFANYYYDDRNVLIEA